MYTRTRTHTKLNPGSRIAVAKNLQRKLINGAVFFAVWEWCFNFAQEMATSARTPQYLCGEGRPGRGPDMQHVRARPGKKIGTGRGGGEG
jgi:hypothetical protein